MYFTRDKKGRVHLKAYDPETQQPKRVPRAEAAAYDSLTDDEVRLKLSGDVEEEDKWYLEAGLHFESWLDYLGARGLDSQTISQHKSAMERFAFKFFARNKQRRDPKEWPKLCGQFYNWMVDTMGYSPHQVKTANIALRKFYQWLGEEGIVPAVELKLRSPVMPDVGTRLPRPIAPDEVFKWAEQCPNMQIRFLGLIGYFMSLRPQEAFAAKPSDFRAGSQYHELECSKTMASVGLFNGLVVYIDKQKQNAGTTTDKAKKDSRGWVCCFNRDAAQMIADIAKVHPLDKAVSIWDNRKLYKLWSTLGIPGVTLKDLRRASIYHLGHNTALSPMQLMKHARHKNITTTMLYCRQPDKGLFGESGELDITA